jgi:uncharacterized protein (DUF433 family)
MISYQYQLVNMGRPHVPELISLQELPTEEMLVLHLGWQRLGWQPGRLFSYCRTLGNGKNKWREADWRFVRFFLMERSMIVAYQEVISVEPGKRGGKPCIRGMRITVYDVLSYLAAGMSHQEILLDFPELTEDDIRACLSYAADREQQTLVAHS